MKGRRVSHSWSMCVVSHGYGGLDGVVDGGHARKSQGVWLHVGDAGALTEWEVIHR